MTHYQQLAKNSIKGVHQGILERRRIYTIKYVLAMRKLHIDKGDIYAVFNGAVIKLTAHTLTTFAEKGCTCVSCGLEGAYFALERHPEAKGNTRKWALHLYGVNDQGEEVFMNRDHIIPRSRGGGNTIDNHDPMCVICNNKKSNPSRRDE